MADSPGGWGEIVSAKPWSPRSPAAAETNEVGDVPRGFAETISHQPPDWSTAT
jgi:hypothetical protein